MLPNPEKYREFLLELIGINPADFVLRFQSKQELPVQALATQLKGMQVAKKKWPTLFENEGIIYPPGIHLEQASSERAARFKADLFSGGSGIDLSCGMGIDSYFLSRKFERWEAVELNEKLAEVCAHNFRRLGADNISLFKAESIKFLNKIQGEYDLVYVDPDRRPGSKKEILLSASIPDIPANLLMLKQRTKQLLIKASPMMDIHLALKELEGCANVWVLAVDNEMKELLFSVNSEGAGECQIHCINLRGEDKEKFDFTYEEEVKEGADMGPVADYIYEPNMALMKAGPYNLLSKRFGIRKIASNTHLYSSEDLLEDFPGKIFRLKDDTSYEHVISRNHPADEKSLRKKFKSKAKNGDYLLAFSDENGPTHRFAERLR